MISCILVIPTIVWYQLRFNEIGPFISTSEILLWLIWVFVAGWIFPLALTSSYLFLAEPVVVRTNASLIPGKAEVEAQIWGWLVHKDGQMAGKHLPLQKSFITLGRHFDCDIVLENELSSRLHAKIHFEHGHIYIVDCESLNGTMVNGQRIHGPIPLKDGDTITIIDQHFTFRTSDKPENTVYLDHDGNTQKIPSSSHQFSSLPKASISLHRDGLEDHIFYLNKTISSVGRGNDCDIMIDDTSVSFHHAEISRQPSGYYIQDLNSSNGTQLNGSDIHEPRRLEDGDGVGIGTAILVFHYEFDDLSELDTLTRIRIAERDTPAATQSVTPEDLAGY